MTQLPSFSSRPPLPEELSLTCRVCECFVRLGSLAMRIITVYGHTPDTGQFQHLNAALFDKIKDRVLSSPVPAIVWVGISTRDRRPSLPVRICLTEATARHMPSISLGQGWTCLARAGVVPPMTLSSSIPTLSLYGILPQSRVDRWSSTHTTRFWSVSTNLLHLSLGSLGRCRSLGPRLNQMSQRSATSMTSCRHRLMQPLRNVRTRLRWVEPCFVGPTPLRLPLIKLCERSMPRTR